MKVLREVKKLMRLLNEVKKSHLQFKGKRPLKVKSRSKSLKDKLLKLVKDQKQRNLKSYNGLCRRNQSN